MVCVPDKERILISPDYGGLCFKRLEMLKQKKLLFKIICFVVVAIAAIWIIRSLPGPGMVLPFKEVQAFSRVGEFAESFIGRGRYQYDIYGGNKSHAENLIRFYHEDFHGSKKSVVASPNKQRYYSATFTDLFEYDDSGTLLRRIPISHFKVDSKEHKFFCTGLLEVSDEKIDELLKEKKSK